MTVDPPITLTSYTMVQHIHSVDLVLDGKTGEGGEYMYLSLVNGINSTFYIVKDQYELLVQTNRFIRK